MSLDNSIGGAWYDVELRLAPGAQSAFESQLESQGGESGGEFGSAFVSAVAQVLADLGNVVSRSVGDADATITPDVDLAEVDAGAARIETDLADVDATVQPEVDLAEVDAARGEIHGLLDEDVTITPDVDAADASAAAAEIDAVLGAIQPRIPVDVDAADASAAASEIGSTLAAVRPRIFPEVDFSALIGRAADAAKAAGASFVTSFKAATSSIGETLSSDLGKGLAVLGGGLAVGGIVGDLETVDRKIRETTTLLGAPADQQGSIVAGFRQDLRDVSAELGLLQTDLVPAFYDSISAGVPAGGLKEFIGDISEFSIAGAADIGVAGDAVTTALNAWQLDVSKTTDVTDSLFAAVQGGKTTVEELGGALFNIAPGAAAMGVKLQEVNAAIATMTSQGVPTSVATTRITAALTALLTKAEKVNPIFQELGFATVETAIRSEGLKFALDAVAEASGGSATELQAMLGATEAVQAVQILAGTGSAKFTDELLRQENAVGSVSAAFETMDEGPAAALRRFRATVESIGLTLGAALAPVLESVVPVVEAFASAIEAVAPALQLAGSAVGLVADAFGLLPGPVQAAVVAFGTFRAASGLLGEGSTILKGLDLISGGFGKVASGALSFGQSLPVIGQRLTAVSSAVGGAQGGLGKLAAGFTALGAGGPVLLGVGAAVGVLGAAWASSRKKAEDFKKATDEISGALKGQDGIVSSSTAALADYIGTASRFADRNQIDDLGRMGLTFQDVAEQIKGGEEGLREFLKIAIDAGEVDLGRGFKDAEKAIDAYLDGNKLALDGNTDLIKSFDEIRDSREAAFERNIDELAGADRLTEAGRELAASYKDAGKSAEETVAELEKMGAIVPEIVGAIGDFSLDFSVLSEDTAAFAEAMLASGATSGEVLQALADEARLTATDLQNLEPQLQAAGTGMVDLGLASSTSANDMAAIRERSAEAAAELAKLETQTDSTAQSIVDTGLLSLEGFEFRLPPNASEDFLKDLTSTLDSMRAFAAENAIPLGLVLQYGEDFLQETIAQFDALGASAAGIFDDAFQINPDLSSVDAVIADIESKVEASANFASNLRDLYQAGFNDVAALARQLGPELTQELVDSTDGVLQGFEGRLEAVQAIGTDSIAGFAELGPMAQDIFGGIGADAGVALSVGLQGLSGQANAVLAPELEAIGITVESLPPRLTAAVAPVEGAMGGLVESVTSGIGIAGDQFALLPPSIQTALDVASGSVLGFGGQLNADLTLAALNATQTFQTTFAGLPAGVQAAFDQAQSLTGGFSAGLGADLLGVGTSAPLQFGGAFVPGMTTQTQQGAESSIATMNGLVPAIGETGRQAGQAGADSFGGAISTGMPAAAQQAVSSTTGVIAGSVGPMAGASQQAAQSGVVTPFGGGLAGMDPATRAAFGSVNAVINASQGTLGFGANLAGQEVGRRFGDGIAFGVQSRQGAVNAAASAMVNTAAAAFRAAAQIQSPSKLFYEEAAFIPAGVIGAIDDAAPGLSAAGAGMTTALADGTDFAAVAAGSADAAGAITDAFSNVELIPQSEVDRSLSLIGEIQTAVDGITLEQIQSRGNVFTAYLEDARDKILNEGVNNFLQGAANNAAAIVDARGGVTSSGYAAGAGSTVAQGAISGDAALVLLQQIADGVTGAPRQQTVNVSTPAVPMIDTYQPRAAQQTAQSIGDTIRRMTEYGNQGER